MLAELPLLARYTVTADDTVYAIPFRVYRAEDVAVTFSTNGRTETALTLGKDYSVQILPAGGAELTLAAGVAGGVVPAGAVLAIASAVPATQEADFSNTATVNTGALETQLDREVQMIQQLKDGLALAVKVPAAGNQSPEELLADIFDARDSAADSATSAAANANAAADSAQSAAGSAAIATEEREAACICAGEAKDARDVAIAQTEAANTLMEAELAKVNAIVAANKTDQQAAVTAARQWAEKAPDTPVDYDEDGNPRYSARHWAENAQKIAIEPPTAERRGSIRVGAGLHLATGENGEKDVLVVSPDGVTTQVNDEGLLSALGGNLLLNSEEWITESSEWTAPVTGWYHVLLFGGGDSGHAQNTVYVVDSGAMGSIKFGLVYCTAGQKIPVVIGAGGASPAVNANANPGGDTSFGDISTSGQARWLGSRPLSIASIGNLTIYANGSGFGGGKVYRPSLVSTQAERNAKCSAYGHFGGSGAAVVEQSSGVGIGAGAQGSVWARWYDPAKAAGPLPEPSLFFARRMSAPLAARPGTVNLYDPETGQGSVWREEDAEAKLAEGLITEEAWLEICAARDAEAYAAWLADPETEAERFAMLRAARDAKLSATDYLVAPDYPLTEEQRAAVTAYRQALRDLPAQEGAPWDGGGELTLWPEMPAVSKVQEET